MIPRRQVHAASPPPSPALLAEVGAGASRPAAASLPRRAAPLRIRLDRAITLRAVAMLAVVFYHAYTVAFGPVLDNAGPHASTGIARRVADLLQWLPGLEQGVAIFFVMAGYFAHRAYQRSQLNHSRHARRTFLKFFLWRRFWRLVPVFWLALLFSYLTCFDHPFTIDGARKLAVNASLLRTLWPGYFFSINPAHWYVAVQWQLDLLYPLFLYVLVRSSARTAVGLACTVALGVAFVVPQFTHAAWWIYLPVRWWAEWVLGVYLADRHLAGARVFPRPGWTLLGAVVVLAAGSIPALPWLPWLAIRVLLACSFEAILLSRARRSEFERRLAVVGVCSYPLYLLHVPVQDLIARGARALGVDLHAGLIWIAFAVASGAAALALAKLGNLFELQSAAWGNRLWRRRFLLRAWMRTRRRQCLAALAGLTRIRTRAA